MMTAQGGRLRVEVYVGSGQPPSMELPPGQVVGPMSIGTSGEWKLEAHGVSPVHGYVYSNGVEFFLRSESAGQPILANGEPVPTDQWMPVRAPCEIKIGIARLWYGDPAGTGANAVLPEMTLAVRPGGGGPIIEEDSTADRGGPPSMTELIALPMAPGAPGGGPAPLSSPRPAAGAPAYVPPRPAAGMPPPRGSEPPASPRASPPPSPGAPPLEPEGATRSIPIEELLAMQAAKASRPHSPGAGNPGGLQGFSFDSSVGPAPGFGPPPGAMGGAPGFGPPPGAMGGGPGFGPPPGAMGSGPGFGAPPGAMGGAPGFGAPPMPGAGPGGAAAANQKNAKGAKGIEALKEKLNWVKARFKEATPVQRILVIMMPLLLVAVWIIFSDSPPPKRAPTKPAASAAATTTASAGASAAPSGSAPSDLADGGAPPEGDDAGAQAPPDTAGSGEAPAGAAPTASAEPPLPPGKKTLQRQAVDAVAAGSYAEAAKLYEELAKAHPDVPAYAEAARIMRLKAGKP